MTLAATAKQPEKMGLGVVAGDRPVPGRCWIPLSG
jgi:hypothetical protein